MTIEQQPKAAMHTVKFLSDAGASQGARRATGGAPKLAAPVRPEDSNTEVVAHARRRRFSNGDKRRILQAAGRCTRPREIGALVRCEGVHSSSLSNWWCLREAAGLAALAPQKRGPRLTRTGQRRCWSSRAEKTCCPFRPHAGRQRRVDVMAAVHERTPVHGHGRGVARALRSTSRSLSRPFQRLS